MAIWLMISITMMKTRAHFQRQAFGRDGAIFWKMDDGLHRMLIQSWRASED
jgi:hypothetical protein